MNMNMTSIITITIIIIISSSSSSSFITVNITNINSWIINSINMIHNTNSMFMIIIINCRHMARSRPPDQGLQRARGDPSWAVL